MSRYRGPKVRICRRLGQLPGFTRKTSQKQYPPGEHQNRKLSEYGVRLEEKQKLRFNYGISEKQLLTYVKVAKRVSESTGQVLLQLLEMRLDNIIFRLGLAPTIPAARQLVNHRHVLVNSKIVSICSYQCLPGNVISIRSNPISVQLVQKYLANTNLINIPKHLELDKNKLEGYVKAIVEQENLLLDLNELLVVEYYSRN